jgi:hypothetical protein
MITSRRMRWARHVGGMGEMPRGVWWKKQNERPKERSRRRWEDNIKMEIREVGYGDRAALIVLRIWD